MEGIGLSQMMTTVVHWVFAFLTGGLLLWYNRENRNPLEWSTVDRCLLVVALFCFVWGLTGLILSVVTAMYFDVLTYVNWANVKLYYKVDRVIGLLWVTLLCMGWLLRRRSPNSRAFAYIVVQYNAICIAGFGYMFGLVTNPVPFLFCMSVGIFNFLIFEPAVAVSWMTTFTLLIVGSTIAIWLGLIPYTPVYLSSPYIDGKIDSAHLFSVIVLVLVIFLLMLYLLSYIFARWRDREVKVTEMTALLKKMFGRYLSKEVMKSLIENPSALELGGERRSVTIMMTDLRGFTALSERLEPERVVQMLNAYFEIMVDVVLKYNGTINEIIGDALLVIFGAPQGIPDRARRAIACSIEMQNAMAQVNEENRSQGLPELEMGIGLNETEVIVGNIGSTKRSKYAVVGSGVNMTSRIESYTVGGQILISESVRQRAGEVLRIDAQRDVLPKGTETPLRIYEVGGIAGSYNLALQKGGSPAILTLTRQIALRYNVLEGKDVGEKGLEGSIVGLSKNCAEIIFGEPVEILTNLKMSLGDVDEKLSAKDFYGKVIKRSVEKGQTQVVRFTSVPPEVDAYFQSHRQHAVKPEVI